MNPYEILNKYNSYAVIGMNNDPDKYAHRIFKKLEEKGKTVYGVSPKYTEIDGHPIYSTLKDIPYDVEIAVFVVNPSIGIHLLEDVKQKGCTYVWLQPGTIHDELLEKAHALGLETVEACVLREYNRHTKVI